MSHRRLVSECINLSSVLLLLRVAVAAAAVSPARHYILVVRARAGDLGSTARLRGLLSLNLDLIIPHLGDYTDEPYTFCGLFSIGFFLYTRLYIIFQCDLQQSPRCFARNFPKYNVILYTLQ